MARKKTQPPGLQFTPFHWTPENLPDEVTIDPREVFNLVEKIKDTASGVATVLRLIDTHAEEVETHGTSYLNDRDMWELNRLAMRSLVMVNEEADRVVGRFHSLARGQS